MTRGISRFRRLLTLALLLCTASCYTLRAQGTTKAAEPKATFSPNSLTVTVGQLKFTKPTLSVTDPSTGKPIRGKFIERWYIKDKDGKIVTTSKVVDSRVKFTDPTTGTTVSLLYGLDSIGHKPGTFTVVDSLLPLPRYQSQYTKAAATYTVTVNPPTVTAEFYNGSTLLNGTTPKALQLYTYGNGGGTSTSLPVPTAKLYYTVDNSTYDVTSYYNYTYAVTDGTDGFNVSNNSITSSLKTSNGNGTLTITATPKDDYKEMLGSTPITTEIPLSSTYKTGKIRTYITFKSYGQDALKFRNMSDKLQQSTYSPNIIIKDEFGNDITSTVLKSNNTLSNLVATYEPLNAFHQFSKDPNDSVDMTYAGYKLIDEHTGGIQSIGVVNYNGALKVLADVHNHPDDYKITVTLNHQSWDAVFGDNGIYDDPVADPQQAITVNGQFYDDNNKNQYTIQSNQYILRVHKRVPQITLTPDPNTISFAEGYTMTEFNRFEITGTYHDPYEANDPDEVRHALDDSNGFTYWFFVPDDYKYDETKTEEENKAIAKQKGHALIKAYSAAMSDPQKVQKDCYEYVPLYNADGTPQTDTNGKQMKKLMKGTYYASMYKWGNEKFTVTFYGDNLRAPLVYRINPWNAYSNNIGVSGSYSIKVTAKEPTHFVIDPKSQVTGTGGTVPCPSITVQDQFGADITSYFTVKRAKSAESSDYTLNDDGSVTSSKEDTYSVTVSGTLTGNTSTTSLGRFFDNPANSTYSAVFKQTSSGSVGAYEIIYDKNEFSTDPATKATSKMGKLHFIKEGYFFPGTISYGEVPGINITFGNADDTANPWTIKTSTEESVIDNANDGTAGNVSKKYIEGDAVSIDDNTGLPKAGCYLKIDAITNGWLTIGGKFLAHKTQGDDLNQPEQYILMDGTTQETQVHSETTDIIKEYTFPKPLLAGHSYYLYTDDGYMMLHGINYTPGFIDPVTDARPWTTPGALDSNPVTRSSAFINGYTGMLPTLCMHRQNEKLSWYCEDVASGSASASTTDIQERKNNEGKHVYVGNTDGRIYAKTRTTEAPLTDNSRTGDAYGRVHIYAKVLGQKKTEGQVMKKPGYWLFIGDMPTYIVQEGESHDQDDRVSTTNIPTRIWMTFGGWHWSQAKDYPYYQNNDTQKKWLEDGWKTSKMDSVGRNNQTIDGFQFVTWGEQNPTDELVRGWDKGKRNTFNLPVRGTYLKFEPEESGQLFVYIVQNGMTDIQDGSTASIKKNGPWLRRRAVYIVDETGRPVAIDELSGWNVSNDWNQYINSGTTNADRFKGYHNWALNYFCDGVTRCAWKYDGANELTISKADPARATGNEKKYSWFNAYDRDGDGTLSTNEQTNLDNDAKKIKEWWNESEYSYNKTVDRKTLTSVLKQPKLNGPLEVLQLSDSSFVLPTKGYVRYTFHVQAGKVYYVFATGSKLGFCGFGFLPAGYRSNPEKWTSAGSPNEYGEFGSSVYDKLPKPSNDIYKAGGAGQNRLMGGEVTLNVAKKATEDGSYGAFKKGGFVLSGETTATTTNDNATTGTVTKRDFVNVTLQRSFRNKRWAGLCLPFTVSETQMKRIFGDAMQLITVDSVMAAQGHERTLHFTQHVNQLCEAGRPYFVYPSVSGIDAGQPIGTSVTFKGVTFESVDTATVVMINDAVVAYNKTANLDKKIDIFTYQVTGTYNKCLIPWMSYYMKSVESEDQNKLYRIVPKSTTTAKGSYLPGCNVYLFPYSYDPEGKDLVKTGKSSTGNAKLASFWITGAEVSGGSTTGIDELISDLNEQSTAFHQGVYDLQGHCVRRDNSLDGLRPGLYLMGGKKYVVK